jgi:membrane fusion protein, multidrug efflux system
MTMSMVLPTGGPLPCALLAVTVLGSCNDRAANSVEPPTLVRTETVRLQDRQGSVSLTGEVQARIP